MYLIQAPHKLNTSILLPSSKSISNRALILNALCNDPRSLCNLSACDDTDVVIKALRKKKGIIDVGAAGTAMRFLTAYLAGQPGNYIITGTERMKKRPITLLVDALRTVGAHIDYLENEGCPPLQIKGQTLKGGEIEMNGSVSSQYISALLMVAPTMINGLHLHLTGLISSMPYIDMTVQLMRLYGAVVRNEKQTFIVPPHPYTSIDNFTVESDWSAASYWYEIVALCTDREASVTLYGLRPDSLQGDAMIVALFDRLGVKTTFSSSGITLTKKRQTHDGLFQFDFTSMPDMAQTLTVTCIMLQIPFRFTGLHSLKIKETDRLLALKTELLKFGYPLEIYDDHTLEWKGEKSKPVTFQKDGKIALSDNTPPAISTYEDHRMAMAFTPISCSMDNGIRIVHPEVVSKSYPSFWNDLQKAHFLVTPADNADCCGLLDICKPDRRPAILRKEIDYYDDEELDQFSGIPSDSHTEIAIDAFREVLYTMRKEEVEAWLLSLQLRNIHLPDPLKDEVLLIVVEQHNNR